MHKNKKSFKKKQQNNKNDNNTSALYNGPKSEDNEIEYLKQRIADEKVESGHQTVQ